jgi:anti-sigma-K factor RskA
VSHESVRESAAAYAVGALEPASRLEFERHVADCAACTAEARSLGDIAALVGASVAPAEPSPFARARLMQAVTKGRRERTGPWWIAAAALIIVAIGLAAYALQLRGRVTTLQARLDAVLTAPDLARIDLTGQSVAPRATARAFWSRSRGLVFSASQLPPLPSGRVYQLWVVTAQAPISAGLLKPDRDGRITVVVETPQDLPNPAAMAVTIEPDGGVPAPTGVKFLVGLVKS